MNWAGVKAKTYFRRCDPSQGRDEFQCTTSGAFRGIKKDDRQIMLKGKKKCVAPPLTALKLGRALKSFHQAMNNPLLFRSTGTRVRYAHRQHVRNTHVRQVHGLHPH